MFCSKKRGKREEELQMDMHYWAEFPHGGRVSLSLYKLCAAVWNDYYIVLYFLKLVILDVINISSIFDTTNSFYLL